MGALPPVEPTPAQACGAPAHPCGAHPTAGQEGLQQQDGAGQQQGAGVYKVTHAAPSGVLLLGAGTPLTTQPAGAAAALHQGRTTQGAAGQDIRA